MNKSQLITSEINDEPVSVSLSFDHIKNRVFPKWIVWQNRLYPVNKIGLHHKFREGATLYHVFSVTAKTLFLRLVLNTDTLHWRLEKIADSQN